MNKQKILIIARFYHSRGEARSIQMRRVISALLNSNKYIIYLVTEGSKANDLDTDNFKIFNIELIRISFKYFFNFVSKFFYDLNVFESTAFVRKSHDVCLSILSKSEINILLTVSTPFESHIVGYKLKQKFNSIRWLTFFSDLWPSVLFPKPYKKHKIFGNFEIKWTKKILQNCDGVISPSVYSLIPLKSILGYDKPFFTVSHCYDHINCFPGKRLDGYFVHSGFLSKERIKNDLIEAIKELEDSNSKFKGFIFIGGYDNKLVKLIRKYKCKSIYLLGKLPEPIAVKIQQNFETSVVIEADMKEFSPFLPSKITDSIINSNKVVVISPTRSSLSDFSNSFKGVYRTIYSTQHIIDCFNHVLDSDDTISQEAIEIFSPQEIVNNYQKAFNLK